MKVAIDRDSGYAPGGYLLCAVDDNESYDTRDESRTVYVQSDWDWPSLAGIYGYVPCECGCTDGTVDATCTGDTVDDMIAAAVDVLDTNLGRIVDSDTADDYFPDANEETGSGWTDPRTPPAAPGYETCVYCMRDVPVVAPVPDANDEAAWAALAPAHASYSSADYICEWVMTRAHRGQTKLIERLPGESPTGVWQWWPQD